MPIRILALLAEAQTARACLEGAASAAWVDPDAQVEVFHVKVDPASLVIDPEGRAIQSLREVTEGDAEQRAQAVRRAFKTWLDQQPAALAARVTWREAIGGEEAKIIGEAGEADLLVLARPHNMDGRDAEHAAVFGVHRPLLVPADWTGDHGSGLAGHIAIAWRVSAQARHAVIGAAPWLRAATKVTLFSIAENEAHAGLAEARHLLHEIAVTADIVMRSPEGDDLGLQILALSHELKADALVMGAYQHGELIEWALGGTTRSVLSHADLPLFLAH